MGKRTQCSDILWHMKYKGGITAYEAYAEYGITRLSARIYDLRERGYVIENRKISRTDRRGAKVQYDRYVLVEENEQERAGKGNA